MKTNKRLITFSLLASACLASGCESMSNTAKGGLVGGGLGAGLGALAGSATGHTGAGAAIGAVAGGLVGGAVGNDIDGQEKKQMETRVAVAESRTAIPLPPQQGPLGMVDIVQLTKDGTPDEIIVNQIRNTHSAYVLSTDDIRYLQSNGVSRGVIVEMQSHRPVRVVQEQPTRVIYQQPTTVIYRQAPVYYAPPPPAFGFYGRWR